MLNINNLTFYRNTLLTERQKLLDMADFPNDEYLVSRKGQGRNTSIYIRKKDFSEQPQVKDIYVNKKILPKAKILAQGIMAKKMLADLDKKIKALNTVIQVFCQPSSWDTYLQSHSWLKTLLPDPLSDNQKLFMWKNEKYERNFNYPEELIHPTIIPGLYVRSKSESAIISRLEHFCVPYHYDEIKDINGHRIAIDFICINVSTGKKWYWDHRGKMDDDSYIEKTLFCEKQFMHAGIIQGINLIVTSETASHPLDMQQVDELIHFYLL